MNENTRKTINGVDIVEDGDVTHFTISEEVKLKDREERAREIRSKPVSGLGKIIQWFKKSSIVPYAKARDLADPFGDRKYDEDDFDVGKDGRTAVEAGIKIKF